jgi:hypothetical protein
LLLRFLLPPVLARILLQSAGHYDWLRWNIAEVVRVVLRRYNTEVTHEQLVGVPLLLEELAVVRDVIDTGENLLKVAQAELFLLEVQQNRQVLLSHVPVVLTLA